MSIVDFGTIEANASQKQLIDALAHLQDTLNFIINGQIDVKNIRANSVNADRIKANTITAEQIATNAISADKIQADAITTDKIAADAVTASKISVNELSAIAADLGHITAGLIEAVEIYGSYIATSTGYPRTEMSTTGNLFAAYQAADAFVKMSPASDGSNPGFNFQNGVGIVGQLTLFDVGAIFGLLTPGGSADIQISSGLDLFLNADSAIRLNGSSLMINGSAGFTGSFDTATETVFVENGIITDVV